MHVVANDFIGGRDGQNVEQDSYEAARFYHNMKSKYENIKDASVLSGEELFFYEMWVRAKKDDC